jgi:hypothetical protein
VSEIAAAVVTVIILVVILGGVGLLLWTCTDGYEEHVRVRKAKNNLALEKARRQMQLDLKLQEWQATTSLEDLARHRERLGDELDRLHRDPQAGQP